ncbi:hypothetical protein VIGAN_UM192400 [Vigna angularis var. angularis]|uniref:Uncharacterized protein n=1 Tax=Vigna angularis var. angularis TaxID=157739 RepID=A0A0S3TFG3_PHAAN|nr:hypothetical protein VIGAN_UM192400 [Vigna angularis var. angularis]
MEEGYPEASSRRVCLLWQQLWQPAIFSDAAIQLGNELISGETVGEVRIVSDMHERKAAMAQEAGCICCSPW